jgi:uncharacterized membrane protein
LGWIHPSRPFSWIGSTASVVILSLLATAELVADKLPKTPPRYAPPGLIARIITGGFSGACIAVSAGGGLIAGAVLGLIGALAGTFLGYKARTGIVKSLGVPDLPIALAEYSNIHIPRLSIVTCDWIVYAGHAVRPTCFFSLTNHRG